MQNALLSIFWKNIFVYAVSFSINKQQPKISVTLFQKGYDLPDFGPRRIATDCSMFVPVLSDFRKVSSSKQHCRVAS